MRQEVYQKDRSSWDNQSGWHGAVAAHIELMFFSLT
jgi:hypothetical protein